jgi:hypothetical protein
MTYVTRSEKLADWSTILGGFVAQGVGVGKVDRASIHLNETGPVQTSQIARNQFANSSQPGGQFFIVFRKLELSSTHSLAARFLRQPQQVCDQTPPDRRER